MRVAVVVRSLAFGGMEKVAVTLSEAFYQEGHASHLIYLHETQNKLPFPRNVHIHSFALKTSMKKSLWGFGYIWKILSQILNILIRNSYFVWSGLSMSILFKKKLHVIEKEYGSFDLIIFRGQGTFEMIWSLQDRRFVFVNESLLFKNKYGFLQKIYAKLLFSKRNMVSVSTGVYDSFEKIQKSAHFSVQKHHLITNPIDISHTIALSNKSIETPSNPYILGAGRLHPIKNFSLLIEAYAYAKKHLNLQHDLVILGEGKERHNIEKIIQQYALENEIHLTGFVENPYPWMKEASLFVLTSKIEGLGMVLVESMVCQTDIVATDSPGGIHDVMTDTLASHICEADTIKLAHKIMEVLQNPLEDFQPYLTPYLSKNITTQFIKHFAHKKY